MKTISEGYINLLIEGAYDNLDPHETLGIKPGATKQEIKDAYRKMSMKYHPDTGGDPEEFKKINWANSKLGHKSSKVDHDPLQGFKTEEDLTKARSAGFKHHEDYYQAKSEGIHTFDEYKADRYAKSQKKSWDHYKENRKPFKFSRNAKIGVGLGTAASVAGMYAYSKYKKKKDIENAEKQRKYEESLENFNKNKKYKKAAHKI